MLIRRNNHALLFCQVVLLLSASTSTYSAILSSPGISVFGSGTHWYKVCSTCPDEGSSLSDSSGGNGIANAATSHAGLYSWSASGILTGSNSLPELKAYTEVTVPNTIGYVSASSTAQGFQNYHFDGTSPESYTITFSVDGTLKGDTESISAGANVWGGEFNPNVEIPGIRLGSNFLVVKADPLVSVKNFNESRSITFEVTPGQDFFVTNYLTSSAFWSDSGNVAGYADAGHTMNMSFTAGNTALLSLVTVPLPPAFSLMGMGLLLLLRKQLGIATSQK